MEVKNRRENDIKLGELIQTVKNLVEAQGKTDLKLEKISTQSSEIFLWYIDERKLRSEIRQVTLKNIGSFAKWIGAGALAIWYYFTNIKVN